MHEHVPVLLVVTVQKIKMMKVSLPLISVAEDSLSLKVDVLQKNRQPQCCPRCNSKGNRKQGSSPDTLKKPGYSVASSQRIVPASTCKKSKRCVLDLSHNVFSIFFDEVKAKHCQQKRVSFQIRTHKYETSVCWRMPLTRSHIRVISSGIRDCKPR